MSEPRVLKYRSRDDPRLNAALARAWARRDVRLNYMNHRRSRDFAIQRRNAANAWRRQGLKESDIRDSLLAMQTLQQKSLHRTHPRQQAFRTKAQAQLTRRHAVNLFVQKWKARRRQAAHATKSAQQGWDAGRARRNADWITRDYKDSTYKTRMAYRRSRGQMRPMYRATNY